MTEVLPRLSRFLNSNLTAGGRYRVHLPTLGSVAFTAGYLAEPKLGAHFEFFQGGISGSSIWACDSGKDEGVNWTEETIDLNRSGDEVAVAISVTHPIRLHAKTFVESHLPAVGKMIHFNLSNVGQDAIKNGGHAFRAATEAMKMIAERRYDIGAGGRIHLFWSAPNAFAFMLGQLARPLGSISLYEFDFEDPASAGMPPHYRSSHCPP